jgi:hypothetical protein
LQQVSTEHANDRIRNVPSGDPERDKEDRQPQNLFQARGGAIQQQEANACKSAEQDHIDEQASRERGNRQKLVIEITPRRGEKLGKRREQIEHGQTCALEPGSDLHFSAFSTFISMF